MKNFLDINLIDKLDLDNILLLSEKLKIMNQSNQPIKQLFQNKSITMIFLKPSTRTRLSFARGFSLLGGQNIILDSNNSHFSAGEKTSDSAKIISSYTDIIMFRGYKHQDLIDLAEYSTVPVINGLTDYSHPCQVLSDIFTIQEEKGSLEQQKIVWIGDSNNMLVSWIHSAKKFNFKLHIASPNIYLMDKELHNNIIIHDNIIDAIKDADVVNTDCWNSMGNKDNSDVLQPYQVNRELFNYANKNAIFMHCLPAYRGKEVTDEIIDSPNSVVFTQAKNRLYVQQAIMLKCMGYQINEI